jgi:hypothetical protein
LFVYLLTFLAGLIFARTPGGGAFAGIVVGVLMLVLAGGFGLAFLAASGLLALFGPQLLLEAFIYGLTGAAGGFVRSLLAQQRA